MELIVINNLAQAIKDRGMNQTQFAEKIRTDQSNVSKLCKQKRFTFERLQEILIALNETDVTKVIRVIEIKK